MPLILWEGKLLAVDGKLAASLDCCCTEESYNTCTDCYENKAPQYIVATMTIQDNDYLLRPLHWLCQCQSPIYFLLVYDEQLSAIYGNCVWSGTVIHECIEDPDTYTEGTGTCDLDWDWEDFDQNGQDRVLLFVGPGIWGGDWKGDDCTGEDEYYALFRWETWNVGDGVTAELAFEAEECFNSPINCYSFELEGDFPTLPYPGYCAGEAIGTGTAYNPVIVTFEELNFDDFAGMTIDEITAWYQAREIQSSFQFACDDCPESLPVAPPAVEVDITFADGFGWADCSCESHTGTYLCERPACTIMPSLGIPYSWKAFWLSKLPFAITCEDVFGQHYTYNFCLDIIVAIYPETPGDESSLWILSVTIIFTPLDGYSEFPISESYSRYISGPKVTCNGADVVCDKTSFNVWACELASTVTVRFLAPT